MLHVAVDVSIHSAGERADFHDMAMVLLVQADRSEVVEANAPIARLSIQPRDPPLLRAECKRLVHRRG